VIPDQSTGGSTNRRSDDGAEGRVPLRAADEAAGHPAGSRANRSALRFVAPAATGGRGE